MNKIKVITFAAVCLLAAVSMILSTSAAGSYIRGDADCDETVTLFDASVTQRKLAEFTVTSFDETAADIDADGLGITDVTNIQRYVADFENIYHINEPVNVPDPTVPLPTFDPYELPIG